MTTSEQSTLDGESGEQTRAKAVAEDGPASIARSVEEGSPTLAGDAGRKKVSVVVPVYFNEESLPHLFKELLEVEKALDTRGMDLQLIFVDDGSGDASLRELLAIKEQRPSTRVVKLARNFGSMHAFKAGLQLVDGDCFLALAADLQDPPMLIVEMVDHWLRGDKYVICARESREDPATSKMFSAVYYMLLRFFVVPDYPPGGYDLGLMDKAMLGHLVNSSKNINTQLFAYWLGFRPVTITYERRKRPYGHSRWTFNKKLKLFLDSLLGFSIVPIRMISLIGMMVSFVSFFYGVFIFSSAILGYYDVRGFATIVSLISFLLGLVIVMLGVIGEYVWRIFDEVNRRPEFVTERVY